MTQDLQGERFVIPVAVAEDLYRDDTIKAIRSGCVPVDAAKPGEVIGIYVTFALQRDGISTHQITHFAQVSSDPEATRPDTTRFTDLPETDQGQIAVACMKLQCAGLNLTALERHADKLDPNDGETAYFELLLTSDLAVLSLHDYEEALFNGKYEGEDREQRHINEAFRLLIPDAVASNHALLTLKKRLAPYVGLVNALSALEDEDGEPIALGLPDISQLIPGGEALHP